MDDFIYLLVLIAWAVFAYYRRSQKKADEARKAASRRQVSEPEERTMPTLEEILMGEEYYPEEQPATKPLPKAPVFRMEPTSPAETVFEREYNLRGITSIEELDRPAPVDPDRKPSITEEDIYEEMQPVYASEIRNNLRQAVIYAEILNRPYA